MYGRKLLWRTAVFTVAAVVVALASPLPAQQFWSDGFESYPTIQTISGKDSTWSVVNSVVTAQVVPSSSGYPVHSGGKCLQEVSGAGSGSSFYGAQWDDDTPGGPHGGLIELSWWMYTDTTQGSYSNPRWQVDVLGREHGSIVALIGNNEAGSMSTIDVLTGGGWQETSYTVLPNEWHEVFMQVDFSADPDRYRVRSDSSATWSDWFSPPTLTHESNLRSVQFFETLFPNPRTLAYFDDMTASVVSPEPSAFALLAAGGIGLVAYAWRRRQRAG